MELLGLRPGLHDEHAQRLATTSEPERMHSDGEDKHAGPHKGGRASTRFRRLGCICLPSCAPHTSLPRLSKASFPNLFFVLFLLPFFPE